MKKVLFTFFAAVFCVMFTQSFVSCSDDDGIVDYDATSYLKYKLSVGADFLQFYDVTIAYKNLDGTETFSEVLNEKNWLQRFDNKGDIDPTFYYIVTAKRKNNYTISPGVTTYDLSYTYGVFWYNKKGGAKEYSQAAGSRVTHANMEEYLSSHPTIEICNITAKPATSE